MSEMDCRVCGAVVEQSGAGRPARYCGEPCRRSAEFKIRRLDRAVERLVKRRDEQELHLIEVSPYLPDSRPVRVLAKLEEQILRAEDELRELLHHD